MKNSEYKKMKLLKQSIKAIPEKETREPLLKSTVKTYDPYSLEGYDSIMSLMFPLLARNRLNKRGIK